MKGTALGTVTLAIATLVSAYPAPARVDGKWKIHASLDGNDNDIDCTFTQSGGILSGACSSDGQREIKVSGSVAGDKVSWSGKGEFNGTPFTTRYEGVLADGALKGRVSIDPFGLEGAFSGYLVR